MDGEQQLTAQVDQQELTTPPDALNGAPGNFSKKVFKFGMADCASPEHVDITNGRSHDMRAQLARGVFYFW
jgi:hypothetical protein